MEPSPRLAASPALRLIRDAVLLARLVDRLIDQPVRAEMGISSNDMYVLRSVLLGVDRPGSIARRVNLTPPSVSRAIDRLVERGLLDRAPAPGDGRGITLRLTVQGAAAIERALVLTEATFAHAYPDLDPSLVEAAGAQVGALLEAMRRSVGHER